MIEESKNIENEGLAQFTPEFLADLVPQTATILEKEDGTQKVCMTYAEIKQFSISLLATYSKES